MALLWALELAQANCFSNVVVEGDAKVCVDAINAGNDETLCGTYFPLLQMLKIWFLFSTLVPLIGFVAMQTLWLTPLQNWHLLNLFVFPITAQISLPLFMRLGLEICLRCLLNIIPRI
jgi:hypothetical protein